MKEVTFILTDDEEGEGVAIRVDDGNESKTWRENSFGYLDQWLRFSAPLGEPVILRFEG